MECNSVTLGHRSKHKKVHERWMKITKVEETPDTVCFPQIAHQQMKAPQVRTLISPWWSTYQPKRRPDDQPK